MEGEESSHLWLFSKGWRYMHRGFFYCVCRKGLETKIEGWEMVRHVSLRSRSCREAWNLSTRGRERDPIKL